MSKGLSKLLKIFLQQPLIVTIQKYLNNPKERKLLIVIILAILGIFALVDIQAGRLSLHLVEIAIFAISFIGIGAGIMIADAYSQKYSTILNIISSSILIVLIAACFLVEFKWFIIYLSLFIFHLCAAILLKNNILKIIYTKVVRILNATTIIKIKIDN